MIMAKEGWKVLSHSSFLIPHPTRALASFRAGLLSSVLGVYALLAKTPMAGREIRMNLNCRCLAYIILPLRAGPA